MEPKPLINKKILVKDIMIIFTDKLVEAVENELKRNNVSFEIDYDNVKKIKEQLKKEVGNEVIFDGCDIVSALEFYKKYRGTKGFKLFQDEPLSDTSVEITMNFVEAMKKSHKLGKWKTQDWNDWLLNYAFQDVTKNDSQ
jgi:hypothetical protein